jgi:tetratricopeptide (TPR) repeat protein
MKIIFLFALLVAGLSATAQPASDKNRILIGTCNKDSLKTEHFAKWYTAGYESYQPNAVTLASLKKMNNSDISIELFFGTWCGDSKREVPRFLKLLDHVSFPDKRLKLIALGGSDSLVKQSPQHEEAGKGIFRVPTFIIYKNGVELGRINEYPVYSLEKDLLALLSNQDYNPNYQSFALVKKWLADSTLLDENISTNGLAGQVRLAVKNEHELNSLGYLLLGQGKKKEAVRVFLINYSLYPESSNVASSLGEGYYEIGEFKKAVAALERALELAKSGSDNKEVLAILYKAKGKEKG